MDSSLWLCARSLKALVILHSPSSKEHERYILSSTQLFFFPGLYGLDAPAKDCHPLR